MCRCSSVAEPATHIRIVRRSIRRTGITITLDMRVTICYTFGSRVLQTSVVVAGHCSPPVVTIVEYPCASNRKLGMWRDVGVPTLKVELECIPCFLLPIYILRKSIHIGVDMYTN